jgi:dihydrofolate reductase
VKVILDMAISPNGLIARDDGDEDWLPSEGWDDFVEEAKLYDNTVMGRETYEQVTARYEDYDFDSIECKYKIIVTRNSKFTAPTGYVIVHSPEEAIRFLETRGIKDLFLIGGGKLNSEFAKRSLINEIHLILNPYIIGTGRPFLSREEFDLPLQLISHKELSNGRLQVHYLVI